MVELALRVLYYDFGCFRFSYLVERRLRLWWLGRVWFRLDFLVIRDGSIKSIS